jgi:RNA polymerase sigma factor (sigma-70 family)
VGTQRESGCEISLRARGIDSHTIEDVRQETFIRVWLAVRDGKIANPAGFGAFVHSVCRNILRENRRTAARNEHEPIQLIDVPEETRGSGELLERQELALLVQEALSLLSQRERELLLAYYSLDNHALVEREALAKRENMPLPHLRVLVNRALKKVAKSFLSKGKPEKVRPTSCHAHRPETSKDLLGT